VEVGGEGAQLVLVQGLLPQQVAGAALQDLAVGTKDGDGALDMRSMMPRTATSISRAVSSL
jgi:hypothetical protein